MFLLVRLFSKLYCCFLMSVCFICNINPERFLSQDPIGVPEPGAQPPPVPYANGAPPRPTPPTATPGPGPGLAPAPAPAPGPAPPAPPASRDPADLLGDLLAPLAFEGPVAVPVAQADPGNELLSLEAPPPVGLAPAPAPAPVTVPVDPLALVLAENPNVQVQRSSLLGVACASFCVNVPPLI